MKNDSPSLSAGELLLCLKLFNSTGSRLDYHTESEPDLKPANQLLLYYFSFEIVSNYLCFGRRYLVQFALKHLNVCAVIIPPDQTERTFGHVVLR